MKEKGFAPLALLIGVLLVSGVILSGSYIFKKSLPFSNKPVPSATSSPKADIINCSGLSDTSCPSGYRCVQRCGPPVVREGDQENPGYYCETQELANKLRNCPICLASNTMISTPAGEINVKDLTVGMEVYSLDKQGKKIVSKVSKVSAALVSSTHQVVNLVLADGREVWVSPDHPIAIGFNVGQLSVGQIYDGSVIVKAELVPYWDKQTYDLLPEGETGFYFANGILMASTLKQ